MTVLGLCALIAPPARAQVGGCCAGGEQPEGEPCGFDDLNGGCNSTPPAYTIAECGTTWCGIGFADSGFRDTDWYLVSFDGGLLAGSLESQFSGNVFVVDGLAGCAPVVAGTSGTSSGCLIGTASALLPPGDYVIFAATSGFDGTPCDSGINEYRLTIACRSLPCPGAGNCFQPNGSPGCVDPACCQAVCGQLPFCCDLEWDAGCAAEALALCPHRACGEGAGPCDEANGTPGCEDPACCQTICQRDRSCCDVVWDATCAGQAMALCGCPSDLDGSGAVDVDDLVLVILDWGCAGVCEGDANVDAVVDVLDLIQVVLRWGPCA